MTSVNERLAALEASAERLAELVTPLDTKQLTGQSYASKWSVADVLSHLGSGATIMIRNIGTVVAGEPAEEGFAQSVWDAWNAKSPGAKRSDALQADRELLDRLAALSDDQRRAFRFETGPLSLDLATFVGLRLNEHTLHTWDIAVVNRPDATLAADAVDIVVDNMEMIARFAGKTDGAERVVAIETTDPARNFALRITADGVSLAPGDASVPSDIQLPSEAFVRLVYGRLDPAHTPRGVDDRKVGELRGVFTGL